jgi:hypothetical protein
MKAQHFASLEAKIQEWADTVSSADGPSLYWGDRTVELMTSAAAAVVDACEESQAYALREGLFKDVA